MADQVNTLQLHEARCHFAFSLKVLKATQLEDVDVLTVFFISTRLKTQLDYSALIKLRGIV